MRYSLYSIKTLFNTHVGSGQSSYGIVDNIVQKDYLSRFPCINATSLKGALREWVEKSLKKKDQANLIFGDANGTEKGRENETRTNKAGTHHFFQASLLSYPMRSDITQFFNVTCTDILKSFKNQLNTFGIDDFNIELEKIISTDPKENKPVSINGLDNAIVESHNTKTVKLNLSISENFQKLFGSNIVIMNDSDFKKIIKKLPIITRNNLENGQSTNLFYEEIVPRETYFSFVVGTDVKEDESFDTVKDDSKLVQIGANATVGYGFCKLEKII